MKRNVGSADRWARAVGALALAGAAVMAPWPAVIRFAVLAPTAGYLLFTALAGSCLGYRLMGRSTCSLPARP